MDLAKKLADVAWDVARVRVAEPSVVTLHEDELRQAQVYRPADLMGTEFRSGEVAPGAEDELVAFFDQTGTDSGSAFAGGCVLSVKTRSSGTGSCCATGQAVRLLST